MSRRCVCVCVCVCVYVCLEFGGIYLDQDVLVLRSFDPLRRMPLTLARESTKPVDTIANGIIVCRRGVVFFRLWMETYRTFDPSVWSYHSTKVPARWMIFCCHNARVPEDEERACTVVHAVV